MRILNLLHLTENHRFAVYRDFSLSPADSKSLYTLYQPMVGARAISLYLMLHQQLPAENVGFSPLEQHRRLYLLQHVNPNEQGRQAFVDDTSFLEAVGLLQTYRQILPDIDETVYVYHLQCPQSGYEFFQNQHLVLLLRDRVGKRMLGQLRKELREERPKELLDFDEEAQSISVPFYELFKLNPLDREEELPPASTLLAHAVPVQIEGDFSYEEIITRFPRDSYNRAFVEQLRVNADQLAAINYTARKYRLSLQDTCRLLDEDDLFTEEGELDIDELQRRAYAQYRQDLKREEVRDQIVDKVGRIEQDNVVPGQEKAVAAADYLEIPEFFKNKCDIHQYNMMLRNEPYTKVLQRFFPGTVPGHILDIFAKVDLNYKLSEEVTNVLIHYLKTYQLSWNKAFIDSVVSDLLGKQVDTYEKAVAYIRERTAMVAAKNQTRAKSGRPASRKGNQKPRIPIVEGVEPNTGVPISDEEYERVLKKMQQYEHTWSES